MEDAKGLTHRLFLIRHGETVDNVAGLYAGSRDSALTNHGFQQAVRLAKYFAESNVIFTHIFSSDLNRAYKTAEAIRTAQRTSTAVGSALSALQTKSLLELREQDFGYLEGEPFYNRNAHDLRMDRIERPDFRDVESTEAMISRVNAFIDQYLFPLVNSTDPDQSHCVAIVSHGMLLSTLWRCMLRRQAPRTVSIDQTLAETINPPSLEHLGGWGNTAYLELELNKFTPPFRLTTPDKESRIEAPHRKDASPEPSMADAKSSTAQGAQPEALSISNKATSNDTSLFSIKIKAINSREHLKGLKRTGGGVGSSKLDESQKNIETFFKRSKPS